MDEGVLEAMLLLFYNVENIFNMLGNEQWTSPKWV